MKQLIQEAGKPANPVIWEVYKVKCEKCGGKMMIAGSKFVTEVDSIDIYSEMKMVCINPKCDFAGREPNFKYLGGK